MRQLHEYKAVALLYGEDYVSILSLKRLVTIGLLVIGGWATVHAPLAWGQEEINRKTKSKVAPVYPDLARRMNITGTVRVLITVSATGLVKDTKIVGGHPVLANAAVEAVKKWRFETAPQDTSGIVEFRFDPAQ